MAPPPPVEPPAAPPVAVGYARQAEITPVQSTPVTRPAAPAVAVAVAACHTALTATPVHRVSLFSQPDQTPVANCADTPAPGAPVRYLRATRTSLLRAVFTGGAGQLGPGAPNTVRTPHTYT